MEAQFWPEISPMIAKLCHDLCFSYFPLYVFGISGMFCHTITDIKMNVNANR